MADQLQSARRLWESDPMVAYYALAVAGASVAGVETVVAGRAVLLPDWGDDGWRWYGSTALELAELIRETAPPLADDELSRAVSDIQSAITESGSAMAGIGQAAAIAGWAVRIFVSAAPIVARFGRAALKIGAAAAKRLVTSGWTRIVAAFGRAPVKTTAALVAIAAPEMAAKVVAATVKMVAALFGHTATGIARGVASGLGASGLLIIGAGLYFLLRRG